MAAVALAFAASPASGGPPADPPSGEAAGPAPAPLAAPDVDRARELYHDACAPCHGADGRGDGFRASELETAPRSFHDADSMDELSVADAYAAITSGVPDTEMASFRMLPAEARWSLAFFALSLRHDEAQAERGARVLSRRDRAVPPSLGALACLRDGELKAKISADGATDEDAAAAVAALRRDPADYLRRAPLSRLREGIAEAVREAHRGERERAERQAARTHSRAFDATSPLVEAPARAEMGRAIAELRRALAEGAPPASLDRHARRAAELVDQNAAIPSAPAIARVAAERAFAAGLPLATLFGVGAWMWGARCAGGHAPARRYAYAASVAALAAAALVFELPRAAELGAVLWSAGAAWAGLGGAALAALALGIAAVVVIRRGRPSLGRRFAIAAICAVLAGHVARGASAAGAADAPALPQLVALGVYPTWAGAITQAGILAVAVAIAAAEPRRPVSERGPVRSAR